MCVVIFVFLLVVTTTTGTRLATISLRPHGLYGPRDTAFIPNLIHMAQVGRVLGIALHDVIAEDQRCDAAVVCCCAIGSRAT